MAKASGNPHWKTLRTRIARITTGPGVYRWLNGKGEILYIGKAKNLRKRMRSYVTANPDKAMNPWKLALWNQIADFETTVTRTGIEALILETNLIKEHRPKYNVLMKDDKNYVYVRVTARDPFPSVTIARGLPDDASAAFGPFPGREQTERTLAVLDMVYRYRACGASVEKMNRHPGTPLTSAVPCLDYQIKRCNGLCIGQIAREEYGKRIGEVIRFFRGGHARTKQTIREEMARAAAERKFERAAKLRDALDFIAALDEQQIVSGTSGEDTDAIGFASQSGRTHVALLRERNGKVVSELSFALAGASPSAGDALAQFIPQYYAATQDIPDTIIVGAPVEEADEIETWLSERRGRRTVIRLPERGKKSRLIEMASRNAEEKIAQQFAKWETETRNRDDALRGLQEALQLPKPPKRIEGYDISHLGGTETVGAMAVAVGGAAANDQYRSFTIRTMKEGEIDDYRALEEILMRRLRHLCKGDDTLSIIKLDKKQRAVFATSHPPILSIPKGVRQEIVHVQQGGGTVLTCDLRRKTKERTVYGSLDLDVSNRDQAHAALDWLEKTFGKWELFLVYEELTPPDILSIHGFNPAAKGFGAIPKSYKLKTVRSCVILHRQRTIPDPSLSSSPDLLLIDGGKGQLSAAVKVLEKLHLTIPVISLAKREEEVFAAKGPVSLSPPSLFLLQRIRDEAHRFSNRHREKRATNRLLGKGIR